MRRRLMNLLMGLAVFGVQLGGCQSRHDASSGEVADPDDGPTLLGLKKMLDHHLTRRALVRADLADHPRTKALHAAYRRAIEAKDVTSARAKHARLLGELEAVAEDPALPAQKLARIEAKLEAKRTSLPEARVEALVAHLESLRARAGDDADRAAVISALSSLETQLDR